LLFIVPVIVTVNEPAYDVDVHDITPVEKLINVAPIGVIVDE
jgi:hypothetical protein